MWVLCQFTTVGKPLVLGNSLLFRNPTSRIGSLNSNCQVHKAQSGYSTSSIPAMMITRVSVCCIPGAGKPDHYSDVITDTAMINLAQDFVKQVHSGLFK